MSWSAFFEEIVARFAAGEYYDRLIAGYASAIAKPGGPYHPLLLRTKFEGFIGRLEGVTDSTKVSDFLRALFCCSRSQFNFNHMAVWELLRSGASTLCITTNFDNAIERASGDAIVPMVGNSHPGVAASKPILIKPHGDVISGQYVATNELLFSGNRARRFEWLATLLENKTIFVVGYSGTGDVDIAPVLQQAASKCGARFIWTLEPGKDDSRIPSYASVAQYDLFRLDPADNWLLGTAVKAGLNHSGCRPGPNWRRRLRNWFDDVASDQIRDTVLEFFFGRAGWPLNHLLEVKEWAYGVAATPTLKRGRGFVQIPDYRSAMRCFDQASAEEGDSSQVRRWKGFCLWRMGRERDALEVLRPIALTRPMKAPDPEADVCRRHYLEVVRDRLRRLPAAARCDGADAYEVDAVRRILDESDTSPFNDVLRTNVVLADIDRLLGARQDHCIEDVSSIFGLSSDLMDLGAAASSARLLTHLDAGKGYKALRSIGVFSRQNYNLQDYRKSLVVLLAASLPQRIEWLVFDFLDGRFLAKAHQTWIWALSRWRRRKWHRAYRADKLVFEWSRGWRILKSPRALPNR